MTTRTSIIILTLNQRAKTIRLLESLSVLEAGNFSIVVWDNGSTDQTTEEIRKKFPAVCVYYNSTNLGVAGGRNSAAHFAISMFDPDFLLFLDNDTIVEPDFLSRLLTAFEKKQTGIAAPKIKIYGKPGRIYGAGGLDIKFWRGKTMHRGYNEIDTGQYDKIDQCIASGGCMLITRKLFEKLNGFDTIFNPYGPEDIDFVLRARKLGYECQYVAESVIYHDPEPGKTMQSNLLQYLSRRIKNWSVILDRYSSPQEKYLYYFIAVPLFFLSIIRKKISILN